MFEKLKQLGYTDEEARKIEKLFKEELDGNYVTKERFNQVNEDNKTLKKTVSDRDSQLDKLSKSNDDVNSLKSQIEQLKTANAEAQKAYEAALKQTKIKAAVKAELGDKVHDRDMVVSLFDLTKIELNDNDGIKSGFEEQFKNIKATKEFLFKPETKKDSFNFQGARTLESNKENKEESSNAGFGAQLAAMKMGSANTGNRAADYYFGTQGTQK